MNKTHALGFAAALTLALVGCSEQEEAAAPTTAQSMPTPAPVVMEAPETCDRDCLIGMSKNYISALVAHNPNAVPLAADLAFVDNIEALSPGEGLWDSIVSAPGNFEIFVPDEINQTVGFIGMMTFLAAPPAPQGSSPEEREVFAATTDKLEQPVIVAIRLKIEDGEITEAEHLSAGVREAFMSTLGEPRPGLLTDVPAGQRMDHDALITMGASYYDALDDNDGSLMPFADDCERHENGMITAGGNAGRGPNNTNVGVSRECAGQLTSKVMSYISRIENRRVFAADPVTGLVMGLSHFVHDMDTGPYEVTNTDGSTSMQTMDFAPFDLPAAHIFKVGADGMVHEIEAMGFTTTYKAPTGWE